MKARIEVALRNRYATLCEYLLLWAETPERDRSHGPEWALACVARLEEIEKHLASPDALVSRVESEIQKAKQSMPKHSREAP